MSIIYKRKGVKKEKCFFLSVVLLLFSISTVGQKVSISPGFRTPAQGAGTATANFDRDPRPDVIMMVYENPARTNKFRYKIHWNLNAGGKFTKAGPAVVVPGVGWEAQGAGVAVVNLDNNPAVEMILMAYDNPTRNPNSFRYKIGRNVRKNGIAGSWSDPIVVAGIGEADGAGVAVAYLDANPRPDMILMAYHDPQGFNRFRYKIGWNLNQNGTAERWSSPIPVRGLGNEGEGAGITITNIDENPRPDMILMVYDSPSGANTFRYRTGMNLDSRGRAAKWSEKRILKGVGNKGQGAGIAAAFHLDNNTFPEYILMAYDYRNNRNTFRYNLLYNFNIPVDAPSRENYVLTAESCRECSPAEIEALEDTVEDSLGVTAVDPVGHKIGTYAAKWGPGGWGLGQLFRGKNWYPYSQYKQTCCGELVDYGVTTSGRFTPDEMDWNIFIRPDDKYKYLVDDALRTRSDDDEFHYRNGKPVVEAELTPDSTFYDNIYFNINSKSSSLTGRRLKICAYGPWVGDEYHNKRPEIHPAELIWWKDGTDGPWHLMVLQDDSNRFDRTGDFAVPVKRQGNVFVPNPPSYWRPWAKYPRTGTFMLAFNVKIPGRFPYLGIPFHIKISEEYARYVCTGENPRAYADSDDGTVHAIQYNGKILVKVEERQRRDKHIGVKFVNVCRFKDRDGKERLQGYVSLTSMVGKGDRGNEGYLVLKIDKVKRGRPGRVPVRTAGKARAKKSPASLSALIKKTRAKASLRGKIIKGSIQRKKIDGRSRLYVDFTIQPAKDTAASKTNLRISKIFLAPGKGKSRRLLRLNPLKAARGKQISAGYRTTLPLPLNSSRQVEVEMKSGEKFNVTLPAFSLGSIINNEKATGLKRDIGAWQGMLKRAGLLRHKLRAPASVQRVGQWQFDILPVYAPLRGGRVSLEDESPFAKVLNQMVYRGKKSQILKSFGSQHPFRVKWTFKATKLSTGRKVPVRINQKARSSEISVRLSTAPQGRIPRGRVTVNFPTTSSGAIYKLIARGQITDTFGTKRNFQHVLWSHALSDQDRKKLAAAVRPVIASIAGISTNRLAAALRLKKELAAKTENRLTRRTRILEMMTIRAAEDSRITIEELSQLIRSAKAFKK